MNVYIMTNDQYSISPTLSAPLETFDSLASAIDVTGCIEFTQFNPHLYDTLAIYAQCDNCVVQYSANFTCFPGKAYINIFGNESVWYEPIPVNTMFNINMTLFDRFNEFDYLADGNVTAVALYDDFKPVKDGIFIGEHTVKANNGTAFFYNQSFNSAGDYLIAFYYKSYNDNSTGYPLYDFYPVVVSNAAQVFSLNVLLVLLIYLI